MCGICGIVSLTNNGLSDNTTQSVQRMNTALAHRGPDDAGTWRNNKVILGHRRLAIMDLSAAGHQPMRSPDGQTVIAFNGEIYNYQDLKAETPDYPYQSHSDTETLLASYQKWGKNMLQRLNGMFAFAIWDNRNQELLIARDHIGIKPLYYTMAGDSLVFASEIRAILASGLVKKQLNEAVLSEYLRYQTVYAPNTLVENVFMLLPGQAIRVKNGGVSIEAFWHFDEKTSAIDLKEDPKTVAKTVRNTLHKVIDRQMMSDVPFGAFLSGGIDSSIIVGLMREVTAGDINTFTVSFAEKQFDETPYAKAIADRFDTKHHEIRLSPSHFLDTLPAALDALDHPSGDAVNTYVVAKATREQGIKMALSGLGGDELFGGYPIFDQSRRLQKMGFVNLVPQFVRQKLGDLIQKIHPSVSTQKMAAVLGLAEINPTDAYGFFREVFSQNQIKNALKEPKIASNPFIFNQIHDRSRFNDLPLYSQISIAEMSGYMQNVLLRDSDQMSMAHALELRVPLLDIELVNLLMGVPDHFKQGKGSKPLFVASMADQIPPALFDRPKMGFLLPFEKWMRSDLQGFCQERIQIVANLPNFNAEEVYKLWSDFLQKKNDTRWSRLWTLVALGHWYKKNLT